MPGGGTTAARRCNASHEAHDAARDLPRTCRGTTWPGSTTDPGLVYHYSRLDAETTPPAGAGDVDSPLACNEGVPT
jgi:hypothetical protein